MGKFKWISVLFISFILILGPIGFLFLPSWNSKMTPLLGLLDVMMGEGGEEKIGLGTFGFIAGDEETLTLYLELTINNSDGGPILFPQLNLTLNYGESILGYGWVNPPVLIPAGDDSAAVPIMARMYKGDAFNQFLLSLIAGGLSLSIKGGEAFVFLETFGGTEIGALSIPLPTIPIPEMDTGGAAGWPPTIHGIYRGEVSPGAPITIKANVSDRGSGVAEAVLFWTNGSGWYNETMTGLLWKQVMGGNTSFLGDSFNNVVVPNYPASPIPTTWQMATVTAAIPGQTAGTSIHYNIFLQDDCNFTTLVPATAPTLENGTDKDTIDLVAHTFNFTVGSGPLSNYTAQWLPSGEGGGGGLDDILSSLEDAGIDIMGAIMGGSAAFSLLEGLELSLANADVVIELINTIILPMIEYLEFRGVNPFEVIDQLLGFSGGIRGIDPTYRINSNTSLALDLLAEGGVALTELIGLLEVDLDAVVDSLSNSIIPPLDEGDTLGGAIFNLLNATYYDPGKNQTLFDFFEARDVYYYDFPMLVFQDTGSLTEYSTEAASATPNDVPLNGTAGSKLYIGSLPGKDMMGNLTAGVNFTSVHVEVDTPSPDAAIGTKLAWEYYDGGSWVPLPIAVDETANLTQSGRIFFAPPTSMEPYYLGTANESAAGTVWIRLNVTADLTGGGPVLGLAMSSVDYVPYYYTELSVDMFGRPYNTIIPGETDSLPNLLRAMNATNGYASRVWSLLSGQGVNFTEFVIDLLGGHFTTFEGPITGQELLAATSPVLALIIYGIMALAFVAAARGRKGTYTISKTRVKNWYEEMTQGPGVKATEELDQYKPKG